MQQIILSQYSLKDIATEVANLLLPQLRENTNNNSDAIMTSKEVIAMCGICSMTLYNYRKEGKLPFKKNGKKIYYSKKDVLALTMPVK